MTRTLWKLAIGTSLALLALPPDALAGRGGGRGGYGGGSRGGYGGESRSGGGYGGERRGGGTGGTPSFSQTRQSTNPYRASSGSESGNRSSGGYANRNQQPSNSNAGAAAAGAGYANRNQGPSAKTGAAAGAGYANRNQQPTNSNAGAAAAGAGYANRNQGPSAKTGAAAGAGYANRNQGPSTSNAGAAAAGAGYANRNQQPAYSNAGAAAAGAGYANRNQQPAYSNAGAAAVGAGYANRNQYNQYHPGVVNGYWNGNNSAAWGASGYGLAAATGVGAWGTGSPMYSYGYSGYSNPYSGAPGGSGGGSLPSAPQQTSAPAYNYSQPINTTAVPPEPSLADQATSTFDQAREAFKAADYANALQLAQQALTQMPNDTTIHEFVALALFAQGKYDQAAAPLYAVLSVGPGWDWTTLSGMYPDVETYALQLRSLEAYVRTNRNSANARFVLAYQYLCEGHDENAIAQLKAVVSLQPGDKLSAQILAQTQPAGDTPPSPAALTPVSVPAADGTLSGRWTASPAGGANIALAVQDDGRFTWAGTSQGKPTMSIAGTSTLAEGTLTLVDTAGQNGTLAGKVTWKDADHFNFRLAGAPPADPGLNFAR